MISEEEREKLQGNFEELEVLNCLKMCSADKSPRANGYTMGLFIKCLEIVNFDITEAFHSFHS